MEVGPWAGGLEAEARQGRNDLLWPEKQYSSKLLIIESFHPSASFRPWLIINSSVNPIKVEVQPSGDKQRPRKSTSKH